MNIKNWILLRQPCDCKTCNHKYRFNCNKLFGGKCKCCGFKHAKLTGGLAKRIHTWINEPLTEKEQQPQWG